jgi:hypothetical protein
MQSKDGANVEQSAAPPTHFRVRRSSQVTLNPSTGRPEVGMFAQSPLRNLVVIAKRDDGALLSLCVECLMDTHTHTHTSLRRLVMGK